MKKNLLVTMFIGKKLALQFEEPALIIIYEDKIGLSSKLRRRKIHLQKIKQLYYSTEEQKQNLIQGVVKEIIQQHELICISIPEAKLFKVVTILFERCCKSDFSQQHLQNSTNRVAKDNYEEVIDELQDLEKELTRLPKAASSYSSINIDSQVDLNLLDDSELKKYKKKMDVVFEKNRKKPTDPDFIYNIEKDFQPTEDSGWD